MTNPGRPALFVAGLPVQQGSKSKGRGGHMREAAGTKLYTWREQIGWAVVSAGWHRDPIRAGVPVHLGLQFVFPSLVSDPHRGWKTSTPDLDKLIRAVGDALTQAGAYKDDAQVVSIVATKMHGDNPGVHITLHPTEPTHH